MDSRLDRRKFIRSLLALAAGYGLLPALGCSPGPGGASTPVVRALPTNPPATLTVVDGVRLLMRNGPTGGSLSDVKKMDTVIASADMVAADS